MAEKVPKEDEQTVAGRLRRLLAWWPHNVQQGEHAETAWACIAAFRRAYPDAEAARGLVAEWQGRARELERVAETLNTYAYVLESVLGEEPGEWPWNWPGLDSQLNIALRRKNDA